ncbi:hypothetical protein A3F38_02120 [Candidatus Saccharibacteria bacterium RIFCSPHIGHO2_12_FULL_48_21]|nr:MAG: hypothetical protein A3F38_02120 [Candidatus Saccharibacteria bacterium RIFCSPHIGHO2_12_FULL_48_21]
MINKFKLKLLALSFMLIAPVAVAVPASAVTERSIQGELCGGVDSLQVTSENVGKDQCVSEAAGEDRVNELIRQVINIISAIVGVIAVVMIIIGGFRYITSGGQPDKVTSAKNTILYGLIGLVIVALAQVIVQFVLNKLVQQ